VLLTLAMRQLSELKFPEVFRCKRAFIVVSSYQNQTTKSLMVNCRCADIPASRHKWAMLTKMNMVDFELCLRSSQSFIGPADTPRRLLESARVISRKQSLSTRWLHCHTVQGWVAGIHQLAGTGSRVPSNHGLSTL